MLTSRRLGGDAQLQKASTNSPALRRNATGTGVAIVQDLLADLGFAMTRSLSKGRADGIFGPETEDAVKKFQAARGLTADGIAGKQTLEALDDTVRRNQALETRVTMGNGGSGYW